MSYIIMYTARLRQVGGSVMLAVPPVFLDQLHLQVGATVGLALEQGQLVVHASPRPRYTLAELLAKSDYAQPQSSAEREWTDGVAVGRELL